MTVFAKIIKGEILSQQVLRGRARAEAFLDVGPLSRGHTLVIPKEPAVTLDQLSDEASAAIGRVLPRICRAVMKATGAKAYNILQNNGSRAHQVVMHVHFHIIPKPDERAGLGIDWPAGSIDHDDAKKLASAMADAITTG